MPSRASSPMRATGFCAMARMVTPCAWISSTATAPMCTTPPTRPARARKARPGGRTGCCGPTASTWTRPKRAARPRTRGWSSRACRCCPFRTSAFRYLEPTYQGQLRADVLPSDRLRDRTRWSYGLQHSGVIGSPLGGLGVNLNIQRVSDDNYWRDFARGSQQLAQLAQRLLPGDAQLSWAEGDMSMRLRTLKWQTLQDVTAPIVPPYDRLPQWQWRYAPTQLGGGFDASVELDATRFQADRSRTGQPNAQRSYALAQISRPFLPPRVFIPPRVHLPPSHYQFDSVLANGARSFNRALPTVSLDSGLFFERDTQYFGPAFLHTLEPRAFYTYTPYRDQRLLPVYDTAANDFNFATIYTENAFGGQDRIADNNLLTLGATTRLLDPATGAEAARFGVAQRLRFSDQNVTLPGAPAVSERLSDVMLGAAVNWTPQWGMDSTVQFNQKT